MIESEEQSEEGHENETESSESEEDEDEEEEEADNGLKNAMDEADLDVMEQLFLGGFLGQ